MILRHHTGAVNADESQPSLVNPGLVRYPEWVKYQVMGGWQIARADQNEQRQAPAMNEWELVFRAISDPAMILDEDHRVLSANPVAEERAGVEPGGLIGKRCYEVFHCSDHPPEHCPHLALRKLQMPITLEMEMEGLGADFLVTVAPIFDEEGLLTRTIHIAKDITDRKSAERALKESEARFRAIFDGSIDGILLADASSRLLLTGNRAIREMLGYSDAELLNLTVADIHPPDDLPHVIEQFDAQLRGDIQLAVDLPVKRKDGSVFVADIASAPITIGTKQYLVGIFRDAEERRKQLLRIFRDTEERLKLEQAALQAKDRVIEQMEQHESYVLDVADRLRNPLQILMGYLELMPLTNFDHTQQEYFAHIKNAAARLLHGLRKVT